MACPGWADLRNKEMSAACRKWLETEGVTGHGRGLAELRFDANARLFRWEMESPGVCVLMPSWPMQRRAGWAIVELHRDGSLKHARYGPVPRDWCPEQLSRDAEDYCMYQVGQLDLPLEGCKVYSDCAGTVGRANKGALHVSHSGKQRTQHLWEALPFLRIEVCKVKAHRKESEITDTEEDRLAFLGNQWADFFAKKGATMHAKKHHGSAELAK
eukprot:2283732-Amphidinium_carterae.1